MARLVRMLTSSLGRKLLMGASGLLLFLFLIAHLTGNLLFFRSVDTFNHYSHALITNPLIVVAELGLLVLYFLHVVSGIAVTRMNRKARPEAYGNKRWAGFTSRKSLASTTMILSGLIVFIFVPLHLWTFKYGPHYTVATEPAVRDLARLMLEVFQSPWATLWYVVAMVFIGFHLWHGFASAFESLGKRHAPSLRRLGHLLAVLIAGGFLIIPVIIYMKGPVW